jgi:subtilase family serine protease
MPATANVGSTVEVQWSVLNKGTVDSLAGYLRNEFVLSRDNQFGNSDDISFASDDRNYALISPGASYTAKSNITIPSSLSGDYYFFVVVDSYGSQGDTNRSNNVSSSVPFTIIASNLEIQSLTAPSLITQGTSFDVSWTSKNTGVASTANGYWQDKVYLSTDNVLDVDDRQIDYAAYSSIPLAANSSYSKTRNINLSNLTDGTYYLIVEVDASHSQTETNETDNVLVSAPVSVVTGDLQAVSINALGSANNSLSTVSFNQSFNVAWSVNTGNAGVINRSWKDTVYLSVDDQISADDRIILVQSQNRALLANSGYQDVATVSIGAKSNALAVDTNGFLNESALGSSSHNTIATAKDLQQNFVSNAANSYAVKINGVLNDPLYYSNYDYYKIHASPGDTISAKSFQAQSAIFDQDGKMLAAGHEEDVRATYKLSNAAYEGDYYIRVAKFYSNSSTNYSLEISLQTTNLKNIQITASGDYYLLLSNDSNNQFPESNEANNIVASSTKITLVDDSDLSIKGTSPAEVVLGQTVPVSWEVINNSLTNSAAPTWVDAIYLSDNEVLDNADQLLNSAVRDNSASALAPGAKYTNTKNITIPNLIGSKYLIFVTDVNGDRKETNESNNTSVILIKGIAPDLIVSSLEASLSEISKGQPVRLTWQVSNIGDAVAK